MGPSRTAGSRRRRALGFEPLAPRVALASAPAAEGFVPRFERHSLAGGVLPYDAGRASVKGGHCRDALEAQLNC